MKSLSIYIILLLFIKFSLAQEVSVKVVFNNTNDIKANSELINKINNELINKENLKSAMTALNNFYSSTNEFTLTDKNLLVYVTFLDLNYFAGLKLNDSEKIDYNDYITRWQEKYGKRSAVLFLFVKDGGNYDFTKLVSSLKLEEEHLFTEVMDFINAHLSGNTEIILKQGTKYLANAIKPVWTTTKRREAEELYKNNRYYRPNFNFFHSWWNEEFIDLEPLDDASNYSRAYFKNTSKSDTIVPNIPIFLNKSEFSNTVIIESNTEENILSYLYSYIFYNGSQEIVLLKGNDKLINLILALNSEMYFDNNFVSKWNWSVNAEGSYFLNSTNGLTKYKLGDKFLLEKVKAQDRFNEGEKKPPWINSYRDTYCNLYALDLSYKLFGNIFGGDVHYGPWGLSDAANRLHYRINKNQSGVFKNIVINKTNDSERDAWDYTGAGYVVYLTAFGTGMSESLLNSSSEGDVSRKPPGHIATCYDRNGKKVIQAGASVGIGYFNSATKAHVYLGYILKL